MEDRPIKIYRIKGTRGEYRPEEHTWNSYTREYHAGSDTYLHSIDLPQEMCVEPGKITCRKCGKKKAEISSHAGVQSKSAILGKLMEHENFCVGRK
jgi:hypothetical protein